MLPTIEKLVLLADSFLAAKTGGAAKLPYDIDFFLSGNWCPKSNWLSLGFASMSMRPLVYSGFDTLIELIY